MRAFLALLPSPPSLEQMSQWQKSHRLDSPGCRPVEAEKLHMTLLFEGQAGPPELKKLEVIGKEIQESLGGREFILHNPTLYLDARSVSGLGVLSFSNDPPSAPLWKSIADKVTGLGPRNRFWPHITLFRRFHPSDKLLVLLPEIPWFSFSAVNLVESILHPEGSRYRIIHTWAL